MSIHKIDAEPRETGVAPNGKPYVKLAYYMQNLEAQKNWKKIPGAVIADTAEDAMAKAKVVSDKLDGLTVFEMSKKVKELIKDGEMVAHVRHLK